MNKTMTTVGIDLTLDQIRDTLNALAKQGSTSAHQIGTLYNHVMDKRMAESAGYRSAQEYFSQHVKAISKATMSNYGTVARSFTEAICTQYGMSNLRELLRYVEVTNTLLPADPGALSIDVPQDDGKVVAKPFSDCSVDELERATRAKRNPPPVRVPVADQARLLFFADSITRSFEGVADVRFSSRSKGGKTLVSLQDVPMTEVERLIQALQDGMNAEPTLAAEQATPLPLT
ncbi:hypothetical protein [Archangium lipolyticum]|uniref:hypothetical protein n=1 Tax=Archangium lipolyticum TaxID=2970465 RepID=UPI00214A5CE1|nr:hypothetical protein [Archangium lipolyticum]